MSTTRAILFAILEAVSRPFPFHFLNGQKRAWEGPKPYIDLQTLPNE